MTVCVLGAGALGRLVAARLALAGTDVMVLARRAEQAEILALEGIALEERDGARRIARVAAFPARATPTRQCELLIVCVKAFDVARALEDGVSWLVAPGAALVIANGLGNAEALGPYERIGATLLGV
ncbi:MAG: 2-dehydropantoate 2-reductase, partial [Planctomycetes bacterium]|nr:2-dehydropantoate 2-reductase [Planctomycetota bacterium]